MVKKASFTAPYPKGKSPYQAVMPIENKVDVGQKALPIRKTEPPTQKNPAPAPNKRQGNFGPGKSSVGKIAKINQRPKK